MKKYVTRVTNHIQSTILLGLFYFACPNHGVSGTVTAWGAMVAPAQLTNAVAVAGGLGYSLALNGDGTVVGWASDGTLLTNVPTRLTNEVAIAAGEYHSLAINADTTVTGWGADSSGETDVPPGLTNAIAIACGDGHSLALQANGTVVAWGADFAGQTNIPDGLSNVVAIAAGGWNCMALTANGTVVEWGDDTFGETDVPPGLTNAVAIASGFNFSLALTQGGSLVIWGANEYNLPDVPSDATNIVAIAAGESHILVLRADGMAVAWGGDWYGEANVPASLTNVVAIAGGAYHCLAIVNDGSPWIAREPLNQIAYSGTKVELSVGAVGSPTLNYQWQVNGTNLPSTSHEFLILTNVQPADSAIYNVVVTNRYGTVESTDAVLTVVTSAPIIVASPTSQSVFGGSNAAFTVTAAGSMPISYQWQFNGTNLPGATGNELLLTNAQMNEAGAYSIVVSNSFGAVISSNVALNVVPLMFASPPQSQAVLAGRTATFSVVLAGQNPFQYQWQFNGTNLPGATANPLVLTNVQMNQAGAYAVIASNLFGEATSSNAALTVIPLMITNQPQGQIAAVGSTTSFSVAASGPGPFSYQWLFQSVNVAGATNSTLVLTNVQQNQSGVYAVIVSNPLGAVTSSNASLAVVHIVIWGNFAYGGSALTNVPASATNVIALAAGDTHCVGLKADGTVVAWGSGSAGQTNIPIGLTNAVSVAAGSTHSLALKRDGTVAEWGIMYPGSAPVTVPSDATNIVALALGPGAQHALALRADGTVLDWGNANYGLTNIPTTARDIVAVAAGGTYCLALRADGTVVQWGAGSEGAGLPSIPVAATNIVAIATSWYGNAALRADGTVLVWGSINTPPPAPYSNLTNVLDLACPFDGYVANSDILALRRNGTMAEYSSGVPAYPTNHITAIAAGSYNAFAVVGDGPPIFSGMPVNRTVPSGLHAYFRMVAAGSMPMRYQWTSTGTNLPGATNSVLVLTNVQPSLAGSIYTLVASNSYGMATSGPVMLNEEPSEVYVQASSISAVVAQNVTLTASEIGQGPFNYQWQFDGTNLFAATNLVFTITNIQPPAAGTYSILMSNSFGVVTNSLWLTVAPTIITSPVQNQIAFPKGSATFNLGLQSRIPVSYQWQFNGSNLEGATNVSLNLTNLQYAQAGTYSVTYYDSFETVTNSATLGVVPVAAWGYPDQQSVPPDLTNVIAIACGDAYGLALESDGRVADWGGGYSAGQAPVPAGVSNIIAIAAGGLDSLALKSDGSVVAWGTNSFGLTNVPMELTNVVAIAAGWDFNLALKADGTVVAWGNNESGQANVPADLARVVAIAANVECSMALRADGAVVAWGAISNVPANVTNVLQVATGGYDDMVLQADGSIIGWGENASGEDNIPSGLSNVVEIAIGYSEGAALKADGTMVAWGANEFGQSIIPTGLQNVITIRSSGYQNLALIGDGPPTMQVSVTNCAWTANGFQLFLPSESGRVYALEYKDNLTDSNWTALPLAAGNGGMLQLTDPTASDSRRFYRVRRW